MREAYHCSWLYRFRHRLDGMSEDFFNGLDIVPLDADYSILSSTAVSDAHPWRGLYQRRHPPTDLTEKAPSNRRASKVDKVTITREDLRSTIRLFDVEAFRKSTAEKARVNANSDAALSDGLTHLSTSSPSIRPVIYRYIDVIKNSFTLLEAIHFELFMPDRPDLRFLAVPFTSIPSDTVEGDYFRLPDADLLSNPSFSIKLGKVEYPVVWEAKRFSKIVFASHNDEDGLAYIVKKKARGGGETAISANFDRDFFIRDKLFPDEESRSEHSLVRVTMKDTATAELYPVEPPLPPPPPPPSMSSLDQKNFISSLSSEELRDVWKEYKRQPAPNCNLVFALKCLVGENSGKLLEILTDLKSHKFGTEFDPRSEYLKRIEGVVPSSRRSGPVVSAVHALSASEAERIEGRLGGFMTYGQTGDLELMDELFKLGSRYRVFASCEANADADDVDGTNIDEAVVVKTLLDPNIGTLDQCRPLLDCIYGRRGAKSVTASAANQGQFTAPCTDGTALPLNAAQSRAVRLYADASGPCVFCVRSPPGSGKTTIAAAMAAEVARTMQSERRERHYGYKDHKVEMYDHYDSVQLLLSVQNVAVDNMGAALKKMDYGGGEVYNMKSSKKLNPRRPAPYDFFDKMANEELEMWKDGMVTLYPLRKLRMKEKGRNSNKKKNMDTEDCITHHRREYEKKIYPKILLSTVQMVLQKMYSESKLNKDLAKVKRVIIDEASMLTEADLFAIIRRFPEARIVLIGDEKQLPPYMYDPNILGQELAGRSALSVAMKNGNVPIVEMNEVYRAPPSLITPYNRLAYGGRIVSKKAEGETPLCDIDLIPRGKPQLFLIDVDGKQSKRKGTSLYNKKEIKVLLSLVRMFPSESTKDIMIICLYKAQRQKLDAILNGREWPKKYNVLTVDSAQGKEAPIVIVCTTRTEETLFTDLFSCINTCNVAVSRHLNALIILGKVALLTTIYPWSKVIAGDDFARISDDEFKEISQEALNALDENLSS